MRTHALNHLAVASALLLGAQSSAAQLWSPADISTELWLDASDLSTITKDFVGPDELVSQWDDKSGNGRHVSENNDGDKPLYHASGFAGGAMPSLGFPSPDINTAHNGRALSWDGDPLPASDWVVFAVIDDQSNDGENWLFAAPAGGFDEHRWKLGTQGPEVRSDSNNGGSNGDADLVLGEQQLYMALSGEASEVRRDGTQVAGNNGNYTQKPINRFTVGARGNTGHAGINGDIAELVLLSAVPNQDDLFKMEGYLAHKWGLAAALPGDHPYKNAAPGSGIPGDTDGDGDIDDTDLGTSFSNYTGPVGAAGGKSLADGDTDGDGDVDDSDLGTSFAGYTGPLGPATVPEPASLALLGLAGLLTAHRRRR